MPAEGGRTWEMPLAWPVATASTHSQIPPTDIWLTVWLLGENLGAGSTMLQQVLLEGAGSSSSIPLPETPEEPRFWTPSHPTPRCWPSRVILAKLGLQWQGDGLGGPGGQAWGGLSGQVPSAAVKENLSRPPSWISVAMASDGITPVPVKALLPMCFSVSLPLFSQGYQSCGV